MVDSSPLVMGQRKVIGKGNISTPGLPSLPSALYVDGLQANLISISHLSDEGLSVMFGKVDCYSYGKWASFVERQEIK